MVLQGILVFLLDCMCKIVKINVLRELRNATRFSNHVR
jgi:hypothetical protein